MIETVKRAISTAIRATVAGVLVFGSGVAAAGYITLDETKMDAIFSQAGFGLNSIDIRINAGVTVVVDAGYLSIDNAVELDHLAGLAASPSPTVNMFFVDAITYCGPGSGFIGCASKPGNFIVLDSGWAANATYGANLAAHELGHNLGLDHVSPNNGTNLMESTISTSFALTGGQITAILSSALLQAAQDGQRFISITPIAVVSSVPEPQSWAMLGLGLLGIAAKVRRRRQCAA